jgi:hypothetical protein
MAHDRVYRVMPVAFARIYLAVATGVALVDSLIMVSTTTRGSKRLLARRRGLAVPNPKGSGTLGKVDALLERQGC